MQAAPPQEFRHTTLTAYPRKVVGVTLLDESHVFTGIYLRDPRGGLWPARTVDRSAAHHDSVCQAWLSKPGKHEDKRA